MLVTKKILLEASPAVQEQELEHLRAKLKQVETERDILKKALSIFSRQQ